MNDKSLVKLLMYGGLIPWVVSALISFFYALATDTLTAKSPTVAGWILIGGVSISFIYYLCLAVWIYFPRSASSNVKGEGEK